MKAIGYVRVSTQEQAEDGISMDVQRTSIEKWCQANDYDLAGICEDAGKSGGLPLRKRPGFFAALEAVRECGAVVLVVTKRDRLARDRVYAGMAERLFEKSGAKIVATDGTGNGDNPEDMLLRGIQDVFAEYERLLICTRTKMALAHKKAKGEKYAPVPFGFKEVDGRLVEVEQEAAIVKEILAQREQGKTLTAIADSLNNRGIEGKRGGKWYASTIAYLIKRQQPAAPR